MKVIKFEKIPYMILLEEHCPSGSINLSRIDNYVVKLIFDLIPSHIDSEYTTHPLKINPFTFIVNVLTKMTVKNVVKFIIETVWI